MYSVVRIYQLLLLAAIVLIFTGAALPKVDQNFIDNFAENVDIKYRVVDNMQGGVDTVLVELILENNGDTPVTAGQWAIYFWSFYMVEPSHLPSDDGAVLSEYNVKFSHINGGLYKMEPVDGFEDINAGQSITIRYLSGFWSVSRTDTMPNWFIAADNLQPQTIQNTADESLSFVGSFDSEKQWKRYASDLYNPFTPLDRYKMNDRTRDFKMPQESVIPTPKSMVVDGSLQIDITQYEWAITDKSNSSREVAYLRARLEGMGIKIKDGVEAEILISIGELTNSDGSTEAYHLEINPLEKRIELVGKGSAGLFYGIQSLLSLCSLGGGLHKLLINDVPRYQYRGMHIDVGRNFHTVEDMKRLLDVMAMYKLNKLHFHLTEDEGWRVEIAGLEELTQIGGQRCFDMSEQTCILSQLGSGHDNSTSGSGFYTAAQYRDLLEYADARHIEVIPEVDMPGHAHAAIKAMEARYKNLNATGNTTEAEMYLLTDFNDTSDYISVQYYVDNALNPCKESTFRFIEHVVRGFVDLHRDVQPLRTFHFGGDEVATGAWVNSSECQALLQHDVSLNTTADLRSHFAARVANITAEAGLNLAGWEDGLMQADKKTVFNRTFFPNDEVYGNAWDNVWEWGASDRAHLLANGGYKAIMGQATHLYFDHPYEPDPEERGLYWAPRYTGTSKVFSFKPDDLYSNIDTARSGSPLTYDDVCGADGSKCAKLEKPENVIGMQGQLWSETVRTSSEFDYMLFPRVLALAERAWYKAPWEKTNWQNYEEQRMDDWAKFSNNLGYKELRRLDEMGVQYRVPPPGAKFSGDTLLVNVEMPGLPVEYSDDGGKTWASAMESPKVAGEKTVHVRTRSADGQRVSRMISLVSPASQTTGAIGLRSHIAVILGSALVVLGTLGVH